MPLSKPFRRPAWLALGGLLGLGLSLAARAEEPAVAAAADLRFALTELADRFDADTGLGVRLSFGSSGNFRRQIAQGAPFELFLSADEAYVLDLHEEGRTLDQGTLYAVGRLVWFVPAGAPLTPDPDLENLAAAVARGTSGRLAIANPEHAPYGRAAKETLQSVGLWSRVEPHLVLGENAAQATQFAYSGASAGGLIPYALALAPDIAARGRFVLIPEHRHRPLRQRMVLLTGAGQTARRFFAYLQSAAGRDTLGRFGFVLPDDG
jgi:molybdate transport system substrate-binding protein